MSSPVLSQKPGVVVIVGTGVAADGVKAVTDGYR